MTASGAAPVAVKGPLEGVLVVDLTRVLAGPYCTLVLADLGARVVKVEAPGRGDDARRIGPFIEGRSAYFLSLNRGKQSIALDLTDAADREVFEALLARADVLVENFRPGAMARLGYGWPALHARFPELVVASTSGFGQTGPYAPLPAYDVVVQGLGGVMSLTGPPGGPPARVGTSIGDIAAGLFTAIGIQAALLDRARSGVGMQVDVAMLDSQVAILENAIARYAASGEVPGPLGTRHPSIAPFQALRTRDGFVIVAAGNDALFGKLAAALGEPGLAADPRFASNASRTEHVEALADRLEAALAARTTREWIETLQAAGVPCGPLNDIAAVLDDPQVAARNMIVSLDDPVAGRLQLAGNPVKLSAFPDPATRPPAPELDADRPRILAELAGPPEPGLPRYLDVVAARRVVARHLPRTPLHRYPGLSALLGTEVWVKHENHHALGAFKVRGGVNLASGLSAEERAAGLFTASTGNHGQSIAFAGRVTGTPVTVAVPEGANPTKVAAMRALGAEVVVHGPDFDSAREWIAEQAKRRGARFIGPTEPELIAGVGTYALEILEDLPDADVIVVPVGAGSGAAGVCLVAKTLRPGIEVIAVQAERAPAAYLAWKHGRPLPAKMETRAEAVATRVPFENTQRLLRDPERGLDDFLLVSEQAMDEAVRLLLEHTHNLAEEGGAAPLAAALAIRERLAGKKVVLVLSGGNIAPEALARVMAGAAAAGPGTPD
jgi:CoA:oxalate CoA-transferase